GQRMGAAAGLIAASSPFLIYHAQDARFYTLFILSSSIFILLTIGMAQSQLEVGNVAKLLGAGLLLVLSPFFGIISALPPVLASSVAVNARVSRAKRSIFALASFGALFVVPLIPAVQQEIWHFHQAYADAGVSDVVTTPISILSLFKIAFAFY